MDVGDERSQRSCLRHGDGGGNKARTNRVSLFANLSNDTLFHSVMTAEPIIITADEINCLIYSYFQDAGMFVKFSVKTPLFDLQ